MSKKEATGDPAFLEQQRKRLSTMRDQLLSTGSAKTARLRAPKAEEAKEIEDDAQDMAQSEVDETIDAVEEQRLRAIEEPRTLRVASEPMERREHPLALRFRNARAAIHHLKHGARCRAAHHTAPAARRAARRSRSGCGSGGPATAVRREPSTASPSTVQLS